LIKQIALGSQHIENIIEMGGKRITIPTIEPTPNTFSTLLPNYNIPKISINKFYGE